MWRQQEAPTYKRITVDTPDQDFIHVDCLRAGHKRLAILCHGLEGSSGSKYIIGTSGILAENKWDIAAINYRSCSGVMNNQLRMYHSGATDDLATVISHLEHDYDELALIGYSLGGNLVLKYLGEPGRTTSDKLIGAVTFSVPANLKAGSLHISRTSNFIYQRKFLVSLFDKIRQKHQQYPDAIDLSLIDSIKTLYDFDDKFTGPINGFADAEDYYKQCSCAQFLKDIEMPTMIVNALDDPFLPEACYPIEASKTNKWINLLMPKYGGHVGFVSRGEKYYWSEKLTAAFLKEKSKLN